MILTARLLQQRHDVLHALANYYKAPWQDCCYLFASMVFGNGGEFTESLVNQNAIIAFQYSKHPSKC